MSTAQYFELSLSQRFLKTHSERKLLQKQFYILIFLHGHKH